MGSEPVSKLAVYINSLLNMGYSFFGMDAPESLARELDECRLYRNDRYDEELIYNKLYGLNYAAFTCRYPGHDVPLPAPYKYQRAHEMVNYTCSGSMHRGHYQIAKWMPEMSQRLACFLYQCEEGHIPNTELFKALKELERRLNFFIVQNMTAWTNQRWGE